MENLTADTNNPEYQVVFLAVDLDDPQTLSRIKAALVGELDFSVEETRAILSGKRKVLRKGTNLAELQAFSAVLIDAGALVSVEAVAAEGARDAGEFEDLAIGSGADELPGSPDLLTGSLPDVLNGPHSSPLAIDGAKGGGPAGQAENVETAGDPLDQISDLFRDLEESCVAGRGREVLNELPKAAQQVRSAQPELVAVVRKEKPVVFQKRFWCRVVSLPELIFSIGFSLLLVLITLVLSAV